MELQSTYHDSTLTVMPLVLEALLYYVSSFEILLIPVKAQYFW